MSSVLTFMMQSGSPVEWAGAFGSILAGLVALVSTGFAWWVASDARKVKLECSCLLIAAGPGEDDFPGGTSILLEVVNVGYRSATIKSVALHCVPRMCARWRKKKHPVLIPPSADSLGSSRTPPVTLSDGDVASWRYSKESMKSIVETLVNTEKEAKSLRCIIRMAHGHKVLVTPDAGVIGLFIDAVRDKS